MTPVENQLGVWLTRRFAQRRGLIPLPWEPGWRAWLRGWLAVLIEGTDGVPGLGADVAHHYARHLVAAAMIATELEEPDLTELIEQHWRELGKASQSIARERIRRADA